MFNKKLIKISIGITLVLIFLYTDYINIKYILNDTFYKFILLIIIFIPILFCLINLYLFLLFENKKDIYIPNFYLIY